MKITEKILSIPPYISTSWDNIASLHMEGSELIVSMHDRKTIRIMGLSGEVIEKIFEYHEAFLETKQTRQVQPIFPNTPQEKHSSQDLLMGFPFRVGIGGAIPEGLGQALQHNPAYSDLPLLPPEVAQKISLLGKVISPEDLASMTPAESNCNCIYCQIMRIMHKTQNVQDASFEEFNEIESQEVVTDEELQFEQWEVHPINDKMYCVVNKLDQNEHYDVYVAEKIGCTCGKDHCEHIVAVLRS